MWLLDKLMQKKQNKGLMQDTAKDKASSSIDKNLAYLKDKLKDCDDVVYREFRVGGRQQYRFALVFVDGLIDRNMINEEVLKSLMLETKYANLNPGILTGDVFSIALRSALTTGEVKEEEYIDKSMISLLSGDSLVLIDGYKKVLVIGSKGWPNRGVQEPQTESVIRGSRDGFTETMRFNTALLRRRIRDPNLKIKQVKVGVRSKTDIAIAYMDNIVDKKVLEEVQKRIDKINIDGVMDSGYIEHLIEDSWYSPFPQIQNTERPDKVAASLLEGRVAIITDNTPFVLLVPTTLNILFQSSEDYYERWIIASFIRLLRYASAFISLVLPATYIAITSYHPGLMPSDLALYIAGTRIGVPFPAFVEAVIMELTLELLREAGVRLPGPIGQTIGIVGGLVIGQAAVQAGLVSPIMVIVVAITAIASFALPSYSLGISFRILRFILIVFAAVFGLYGLMMGILLILVHLCSLKSFGVPYLSPLVGNTYYEMGDTFVRMPLIATYRRPKTLAGANMIRMRMGSGLKYSLSREKDGQRNNGKGEGARRSGAEAAGAGQKAGMKEGGNSKGGQRDQQSNNQQSGNGQQGGNSQQNGNGQQGSNNQQSCSGQQISNGRNSSSGQRNSNGQQVGNDQQSSNSQQGDNGQQSSRGQQSGNDQQYKNNQQSGNGEANKYNDPRDGSQRDKSSNDKADTKTTGQSAGLQPGKASNDKSDNGQAAGNGQSKKGRSNGDG
jgi:spore germination protein